MSRMRVPRRHGSGSSRPAAVFAAGVLGLALLSGALAGCAPGAELGRDAATQLQSQVRAVTETAAANDPAGSLKLLDELVTKLDEAAARGEVSFKRHQSIRKSVDAVRADLTAQQAEAEAARVAAEQEAAAQAAAAAAAAQAPPPAIAPAPPAGKGKGKGKDDDD
ncbi:mucin-associated surface protein [Arthrobacter sp. RHLT1-20]